MVRDLIVYPTVLSLEFAKDVRCFNDELFALIEDLKDTINENNLEGLAAFQVGNAYNVVLVKQDEATLLEMVNPRLISYDGRVTAQESTAYYPGLTAITERYETIKVVYQDRDGNDKSLEATGPLAIVIQRKIDYTFGATFIHKMSNNERKIFEKNLKKNEKSWLKRLLPL